MIAQIVNNDEEPQTSVELGRHSHLGTVISMPSLRMHVPRNGTSEDTLCTIARG